eukprot:g30882.t1
MLTTTRTGRPFLSLFREERVERSTRELLRREAWAASALSVLGVPSTEVFAEGFDPFGEELKKQAPQDLKTPPEDAQVSPSGLKWKILKAADAFHKLWIWFKSEVFREYRWEHKQKGRMKTVDRPLTEKTVDR